jgi:molybdopterin synthase sulfur carrier subunit
MKYRVLYFASLRDVARRDVEDVESASPDARALYTQLCGRHGFILTADKIRLAVNGEFAPWDRVLADGDEIAFLPPVSGG